MLETILETTWNLCKEYDDIRRRCKVKVLLVNFVSARLEQKFSAEIENLCRAEWLAEVDTFCQKYGYVA